MVPLVHYLGDHQVLVEVHLVEPAVRRHAGGLGRGVHVKGRDPHASSIRAAASVVSTSEEDITARGNPQTPSELLPREHPRHGRIRDQVLGLPRVQACDYLGQWLRGIEPADGDERAVHAHPTRADWCQGTRELTTPRRVLRAKLALMPAHSCARA